MDSNNKLVCRLPAVELIYDDDINHEQRAKVTECGADIVVTIWSAVDPGAVTGKPNAGDAYVDGWKVECQEGHVLMLQDPQREEVHELDLSWLGDFVKEVPIP